MNYRNILERFCRYRGYELSLINGKWYIVDGSFVYTITLRLYREIVETLETNGKEAWFNIDLLDWRPL